MPYIAQAARQQLASGCRPATVGELNYAITKLVHRFLRDDCESYTAYNAAIGVLECAKLELYRRIVAPYEDSKCNENGDVYE